MVDTEGFAIGPIDASFDVDAALAYQFGEGLLYRPSIIGILFLSTVIPARMTSGLKMFLEYRFI